MPILFFWLKDLLLKYIYYSGDYQNAVIEHEEEIYLSEVSGDAIGVAVGHRKVGEAYCSLEMFEKAFFHQQKYLEVFFFFLLTQNFFL